MQKKIFQSFHSSLHFPFPLPYLPVAFLSSHFSLLTLLSDWLGTMASAFPLKIVFLLFCVISCIMAMVALFTNNWYKVDGETFGLLPKHCQKVGRRKIPGVSHFIILFQTEGVDDEHAKHCKELIDVSESLYTSNINYFIRGDRVLSFGENFLFFSCLL